jgi:hypothetical protein
VCSGEVAILFSNVFKLTHGRVHNLNITGHILLTPDVGKVEKVLISNFNHIKFVITFPDINLSIESSRVNIPMVNTS